MGDRFISSRNNQIITGCIQIINTDFIGMDYLHLLTCSSQTGTIQEKQRKIKAVLSTYFFFNYLVRNFPDKRYQNVSNLYTMVKDNFSFVDYSKIDIEDYQIIEPITQPKIIYEEWLLLNKYHKRTNAQSDTELYKPKILRANYKNVL